MIRIDGSYGEGGGQILRTAITLSSILGKPIEISNIRKNRANPGLQPQHLTCVNASKVMAQAEVEGNELGSLRLRFLPKQPSGGDFLFDVAEKRGSAGAVTLILQTLLPILMYAPRDSRVTVRGGTHVPWSPSFHYFQEVFLGFLKKIGVNAEARIEKWGFYPKGGGEVILELSREGRLRPFLFRERGELRGLRHLSCVANLTTEIAKRQVEGALAKLGNLGVPVNGKIQSVPSVGPGTFFFWLAEFDRGAAGFDALGALGKRAERVGWEATEALLDFLKTRGAVDTHLADQICLYAALAEGRSEFVAPKMTQHLGTNLWVIQHFLNRKVALKSLEADAVLVSIE